MFKKDFLLDMTKKYFIVKNQELDFQLKHLSACKMAYSYKYYFNGQIDRYKQFYFFIQ